jgi:hypothetical protein
MRRSSPGLVLALAGLGVMLAARCTDITVNRDSDGTTSAVASGPDVPPVEIDEEGVHDPPTPTPGPYEPIVPITPPAPTPTPRPK